jgi:cobalt-zinc-cadmium efflux system membrane fusion protein
MSDVVRMPVVKAAQPRSRVGNLVLVGVATVGALLLGSCSHKAPEPVAAGPKIPADEVWLTDKQIAEAKLMTDLVAEQEVDDTILTGGKISFDDLRVSHVFSPVNGKVTKIEASLGQRVKKGDPLAVIESPDIGTFSSDLGKAQADLVAAEHDYNREKALWEQKATSQKDYETAEDNYRKAKAELDRARQKAFMFRAGSVDAVSQSFTLRTGIDGEVIARMVNPNVEIQGQYGGSQVNELFTIGDLDQVWLIADVYEMDFARVHVGATMTPRIIAYPKLKVECKVDWVSGTLDPVTRTAKARCSLPNADRALKPEMYATVAIAVEQRKALAIPRDAFFRMGDATVSFVQLPGLSEDKRTRFRRMPVVVDDEGEGSRWLVLKRGLEKGQRIVVSGGELLTSSG